MNILGIDIGNYGVKIDNGLTFESTVKNGHIRMNSDDIQISYNGQNYTIGSKDGSRNIGMNKYKKLHFKLLLLTAIAKSCNSNKKNIITSVVVGVPITMFNNKDIVTEVEKEINKWKREVIIIDGVTKTIDIQKVKIFCESAIVFSDRVKYKDKKALIIDIGGSTVDVSVWDNFRLEKAKSYKKGTISLCENIAVSISDNEKVLFKSENVPQIINNKVIRLNQKEVNIKYVDEVIQNYIDDLSSKIYQSFDPEEVDDVVLCGGGSQLLKDQLLKEFTTATIEKDSMFLNCKTYKKIGATVWQV